MGSSAAEDTVSCRRIVARTLPALSLVGSLFALPARGVSPVDISVHLASPPPLHVSAAVCHLEGAALSNQCRSTTMVSPECHLEPLPGVLILGDGLRSPPGLGTLARPPFSVTCGLKPLPGASMLGDGLRSSIGLCMFARQPFSMTGGVAGAFMRDAAQEHSLLLVYSNWVSGVTRHMPQDTKASLAAVRPVALSPVRLTLPGHLPINVRPPVMAAGQKTLLSVKPSPLAPDLRRPVRENPLKLQVPKHISSEVLSRIASPRLVSGILDAAEKCNGQKLDDALKDSLFAILTNDASDDVAYRAYLILLADSAGTNDTERCQALLTWAETGGSVRSLNRLSYFMALHNYRSLRYDAALMHIDRQIAVQHEGGLRDEYDRFLMLKALCEWGEGNDGEETIKTIERLLSDCPDSPLLVRALFLRSWVHLYCGRPDAARTGFEEIIARYPRSEFVERAKGVLQGMGNKK